ncbi:MAG: hypothetical protein P8L68_14545 [Paracoccaceae bacterium]|nr:hypothetical protein [Paracoccaceae bacterium]
MYVILSGGRRMIRPVLFLALMVLAACTGLPFVQTVSHDTLQVSQQFVAQRLDQSWARPHGAIINIGRSLGKEAEQIIGLVNETTISGDNFLWLRARVPDGSDTGYFNLQEFLSRTEGVPVPFLGVSDANLHQATDSLGTYFYLEWRSGSSTNCVLAFRRIMSAARILPSGTNVLEAMLRNCVQGPIADALAPIQDREISFSATTGTQYDAGRGQILSPLAAPLLE